MDLATRNDSDKAPLASAPVETQKPAQETPAPQPQQQAEAQAGAAAILRMAETNVDAAWNKVHDMVLDGAGEAVGYAELLGLRYPVKAYEAQVDGNLYRGSRVDFAGMASLKAQGIKGVVNLCAENNNDEAMAQKLGMTPHHIPILDNSAPTMGQMQDFIAFATSVAPCYVHCEAGKGRTGTAVASYRMAVDGFTTEQAIAEARSFGLSLPNQIQFLEQFGAQLAGKAAEAAPAKAPAPDPGGAPK